MFWNRKPKEKIDDGRDAKMKAIELKTRVASKIMAQLNGGYHAPDRRVDAVPINFEDRRQPA